MTMTMMIGSACGGVFKLHFQGKEREKLYFAIWFKDQINNFLSSNIPSLSLNTYFSHLTVNALALHDGNNSTTVFLYIGENFSLSVLSELFISVDISRVKEEHFINVAFFPSFV